MGRRLKMLTPIICLLMLGTLPLSGCGKPAATANANLQTNPVAGAPSTTPTNLDKSIVNAKNRTPEEKSAAREALRYAEDANTGSRFKAAAIRVSNGWARVAVEQTEVPADEAVSFGVYLRLQDDGRWEVAETGTGVSADELPEAPSEIFKSD